MAHTYLRTPPAPNLPFSPEEWDRRYQDQFTNILRLYFTQLSGALQQLTNTSGGFQLSFPVGSFRDITNQTAANTTTAYVIKVGNTDYAGGVSLKDGSKFVVSRTGVFNFQFSVQLNNNDTAPQDVEIWFRVNGMDVPNSGNRYGLAARKNVGDPFHIDAATNLFLNLNADDYVELVWRTSSINASIAYYAPGTAPTRPAIPSVVVTASFASAAA